MPRSPSPPESRRPRVCEMNRIDTKSVRPFVQRHQRIFFFPTQVEPIRLELIWLERRAGTWGPGSAAYATQLRRSITRPLNHMTVRQIENIEDRGHVNSWILYFCCPMCSRRCRVLYSRMGTNDYGCVKCNRPAYPSNCWPYTGRKNARGISLPERERMKHLEAARKLREQLRMAPTNQSLTSISVSSTTISRPSRMSHACYEELKMRLQLEEMHVVLASLRSTNYTLQTLLHMY